MEDEKWVELSDMDLQNLDGGKRDRAIWIDWLISHILAK